MIGLNPVDIISEKRNISLLPIFFYIFLYNPISLIPCLEFKFTFFFTFKLTIPRKFNFRIRLKFERFYDQVEKCCGGSPRTEWHVLFREHITSPILNPSPEMGAVSPGIHVRPTLSEFERRQTSIQRVPTSIDYVIIYRFRTFHLFIIVKQATKNVSKYSLNCIGNP